MSGQLLPVPFPLLLSTSAGPKLALLSATSPTAQPELETALKHQRGKPKLQKRKRKRGPLGIVVLGSTIRQEADFSDTQESLRRLGEQRRKPARSLLGVKTLSPSAHAQPLVFSTFSVQFMTSEKLGFILVKF